MGQVVLRALQVEMERKVLQVRMDLRELLDLQVFLACQVLQGHCLTFSLTSTGSRCLRGQIRVLTLSPTCRLRLDRWVHGVLQASVECQDQLAIQETWVHWEIVAGQVLGDLKGRGVAEDDLGKMAREGHQG